MCHSAPTTTSPSPSTGSPRFPLATSPTIPRYANTAQHTRTPEQHTAQAHLARDLSNIREAQQQQRSRSRQAVTAAAAAKENVGKTTTNTRVAQQHPVATVHTSANRKGSSPPNLSQLDVNTPASQHRRSTPLVNSNPSISMTSFSGGHGPPQQQQQQQHHVASSGNGNGTSPLFDSHLQMAIVRSVFQLCALPAQGVSFERFVDFVSEIGILGTSDSIHERRDVRAVFVAATGFTRKGTECTKFTFCDCQAASPGSLGNLGSYAFFSRSNFPEVWYQKQRKFNQGVVMRFSLFSMSLCGFSQG